jgi:hypothetical protein
LPNQRKSEAGNSVLPVATSTVLAAR